MKFYSTVFKMEIQSMGPKMPVGVFDHAEDGVSGCIFVDQDGEVKPSKNGPLVYLNADGRLTDAANLVEKNNGKVVKPKHAIGPYGFRVICIDSEGNRIALHSQKDS